MDRGLYLDRKSDKWSSMDHPGHSGNPNVVYGVQGAYFTRRQLLGKLRSPAIGAYGEGLLGQRNMAWLPERMELPDSVHQILCEAGAE